ncbi:hypothetical protein WQ57_13900 [Mesobacillus campisalis]|uniref:Cytoplasmic protein n=1 Tax=Mesobacillus campisalis TaxID=1408103 RepID=A0A0M2SX32_9BACI|nr:YwqG family protein [Mesobacillus campisalis]KKK37527.1 hypothetical protein WQ57_13900 [Mesobacillus campisalis]
MNDKQFFKLSKTLEPYRNEIEKTAKPCISITTVDGKPALYESKFGGFPYLPKGADHPLDEKGRHMSLLAQYRFSDIPKLPGMPLEGMIQFFLSAHDDMMGLDFDDPTSQKNFRVVYHAEVLEDDSLLVTDFSYMEEPDEDYLPIEGEWAISFSLAQEPVPPSDFQFEELMKDMDCEVVVGKDSYGELTLIDVFSEELSGEGHKIGGYAYFTQEDPRCYEHSFREHDILLLQMDSEDEREIMWGDCGVGNFFIRKEDLEKLDFSRVLYNWDCS